MNYLKFFLYFMFFNMLFYSFCNDQTEYLYKIVKLAQWEISQQKGQIIFDSNDKDFVHFSKEDQWKRVANKFYSKESGYCLLKFRKKDLECLGDLVFETNPAGTEKYYHLKPNNNIIVIPTRLVIENTIYLNIKY